MDKKDIFEFLSNGGKLLGQLGLQIYGESLTKVGEQAFSEAIEIGIINTIATLYEAKVPDEEILRVVNAHWGIDQHEVSDRLIFEKQQATIRSLEKYLKLQGYSKNEMREFMKKENAKDKIRHNKDLWQLKDKPEKLMNAISSK